MSGGLPNYPHKAAEVKGWAYAFILAGVIIDIVIVESLFHH